MFGLWDPYFPVVPELRVCCSLGNHVWHSFSFTANARLITIDWNQNCCPLNWMNCHKVLAMDSPRGHLVVRRHRREMWIQTLINPLFLTNFCRWGVCFHACSSVSRQTMHSAWHQLTSARKPGKRRSGKRGKFKSEARLVRCVCMSNTFDWASLVF